MIATEFVPLWVLSITYNCYAFCITFALFYIVLFTPLLRSYYPPTTSATSSAAKAMAHSRAKHKLSRLMPQTQSQPPTTVSGGLGLDTLQQVLESVPGRRAFEKHLMLEFSIESLLFVRVC